MDIGRGAYTKNINLRRFNLIPTHEKTLVNTIKTPIYLFRSLQKENEAIKDFKSDLSSVNVELLKECRQENQQFR